MIVPVLGAGCGNSETNANERSRSNMFFRGPGAYLKDLTTPKIAGDHLVTYFPGDLTGMLSPVEPVEIVTRGNPELKRVAITIEDGWNADMRILRLLKSWKVQFTAFLIGGRGVADANPEFVRAIQETGGEVCNHTYTHFVMKGKDEATVVSNIWQAQNVITHITHEIYPYVRFSGGAYDAASLTWAARQGFWVVNWTASSGDTSPALSIDAKVNNILGNVVPGAILLFHFGGYGTYEVLSRVIPEIQKRGYQVTSLSRVLEGTPFRLKKKPGVRS